MNNYNSYFGDFSIKRFKDNFTIIKEEIIKKNNFNFRIDERDINIFFEIIKNYGFKMIYNSNFISKAKNIKNFLLNNNIDNNYKKFLINQIILSFIYLYFNQKNNSSSKLEEKNKKEKIFKKLYNNLYIIILRFSFYDINNKIFDIGDILEIFRFNIIFSLKDLFDKNMIFNLSIIYLTKLFIENNKNIEEVKPFNDIIEQIYNNLLNNKKNLNFLKRDKNIENFSIVKLINITCCSACDIVLKTSIFKLLDLVYNTNYSNTFSNLILNNIKECFYELKTNYDKNKIINCIKYLNGQTEFINYLFNSEENQDNDIYMPSTYFAFDGSKDSGINYNPNSELIKKNFTLVFAFKYEETNNDKLIPIITFITENTKKEIIFNLSIQNNQLFLYGQGDTKMNLIEDISCNKSYLIVVEYFRSGILKDKIKVSINGNKKEINSCNISYKLKSSLKVGYISNDVLVGNNLFQNISNFKGIIGPIIFFNNILDEKDFVTNILKLKGRYDSILFLNKLNNVINYFYYEEYKLFYDNEFLICQEYFFKLSKKIDEEYNFTLHPLSMINSIEEETNFFREDIFKINNKEINNKDYFPNFNILHINSSKINATYAKKNRKSISIFVEYDGISLYTLIIEYYYNLLRMLINDPKEEKKRIANEINNGLCHIINSITKILIFFKIDSFKNDLDTFGFSIKKLMNLLIDIQPLNYKLVNVFINSLSKLIDYQKTIDIKTLGKEILNFVNKLFSLICSCEYIQTTVYQNAENFFNFFKSMIIKSDELINIEILNSLLSFSFILDAISFDKHNNKKYGYSFHKNEEYKRMGKVYKNLISTFIERCDSFKLYIKYIQIIMKKNISMLEKYKLMKIYYKSNITESLYESNMVERNEIGSSKSILNIFKKDKNINKKDNISEEDLLNEYNNGLSKLINCPQRDKYYELLKSIFVLLIYEYNINIKYNISKNNDNLNSSFNKKEFGNTSSTSLNTSIEKIYFFDFKLLKNNNKNNDNKMKNDISLNNSLLNISPSSIKNEKNEEFENSYELGFSSEDNDDSLDLAKEETLKENNTKKEKNNKIKGKYILDTLLKSRNFSFYIIKAIFACLCEKWDKMVKIKFIKSFNEKYDEFDLCSFEFSLFKKELFSQYIKLIEYLSDAIVLERSLKFILIFMLQTITSYQQNCNNKYSKSILLHLFESKSIMNNFFDFCVNSDKIKDTFKKNIIPSIKDINNNVLLYHPRPFIFSYIKRCIDNVNSHTVSIIYNICDFISQQIKRNNKQILKINNYLYFNEIRFISTLIKKFEKNQNESQNLLTSDDLMLFTKIQSLVNDFSKSEILYDNQIYIFNPDCFYEPNKKKENKDIKILQSQETKILNNQILFLDIFELSLISSYLIWISPKKEEIKEKNAFDNISKLDELMSREGHFISYYFDKLNNLIQSNNKKEKEIPLIIKNNDINIDYKHYLNGNPPVKDTRIISAQLFLIILKYQSLFINYKNINTIKEEKENNLKENLIRTAFNNIIKLAKNDILSLGIKKVKEDKKFEIILEKEPYKCKEFYRNYYKFFIDSILKKKNPIDNIGEEIEKKFMFDELDKKRKTVSFLNDNIIAELNIIDKKEIYRKDSYNYYNEDEGENSIKKMSTKNAIIKDIKDKNKTTKNTKTKDLSLLDFDNALYPILCTKRDLILTKFGYFYYKDYFRNNKFIKLKNLFFYNYNPKDENNCYHGFQKMMKNKYPYKVKNFSNHTCYFPRMFFRPNTKFFENKYLSVSHQYFNNELYDSNNEEKILHLEYGHGLLNQPNFDLFSVSNNINEENSGVINKSINSNGSGEKFDSSSPISNEEYEEKKKLYDRISKNFKTIHLSNKNLYFSLSLKEDINLKRSNIKRSLKQNRTNKEKDNLNILNLLEKKENKTKNNALFECELISPKSSSHGLLLLSKNFLIFQTDSKFDVQRHENDEKYLISSSHSDLDQTEKQIIIQYNSIFQIMCRKFLFYNQAFEIFLYNGKSYYFNLYKEEKRNNFINQIKDKLKNIKKNNKEQWEIIEDSVEYFNKNRYLNLWIDGKLSTIEYLLLINKFSDRTYNVLSQYLIFPWILRNFNEIYKSENYRNFSFPMSAQTPEAREEITKEYNNNKENDYKYFYPCYYLTSLHTNNFLIRFYPYINNQIKCQGGKFDSPERQFDSFQNTCKIFTNNKTINFELIPEFYFVPEVFLNLNYCFYGKEVINKKQLLINNINLGEGFKSIIELINFHQISLNSDTFTSQINKWIDNVFGENQLPDKKIIFNSFPKECYEKYVKEEITDQLKELEPINEKINECMKTTNNSNSDIYISTKSKIISNIKEILLKTYFYGPCPLKLFNRIHPTMNKKIEPKMHNLNNIDNIELLLKNECINLQEKDLLYMNESFNGTYIYILLENQIIVYNKLLKRMNNLSINYINKIHPPFSFNYDSNIINILHKQSMYKYLIFEILDCKYFFVAGYLDNSFRIYSKEKDKDIMYSIYTESKVTCIKNIPNSNIFYIGHQNGKITKWSYSLTNKEDIKKDSNQMNIKVSKKQFVYGHQSFVKIIEINNKYGFIISAADDGLIFIRKIYNFELLSYIKLNKFNNEIIDINLYNQLIIVSVFKTKKKQMCIYTYSVNGMKLGKMGDVIKLPISIIPETDDIFIFGCSNLYLVKVTLKERISLISITNNLVPILFGGKDQDDQDGYTFNEDFIKSTPISYFYDAKNRVLFCLFNNGNLHRINLIKNL